MDSIIRSSGTGKTKELIYLASKNNGIIVCKNPAAMCEKMYSYGYTNIEVISYDTYLETCVSTKNYYVDEIDSLLELIGIKGFTLTTNTDK